VVKKAALIFALASLTPVLGAQVQDKSPRIVGMAHMAYYVTDLGKARAYYEGLLGFQEAFALKNADGSDHIVFIKVNDHQYIELVAEAAKNHGFLYDAGFETNDAKGMRDHLASLGIPVPEKIVKDATGNLSFDIKDPSGFTIQIVQYLPDSLTGRTKGKLMPASRISSHIDHLGLLVNDRESSWKFYGDTFGFVKEGDGSKMVVPGSEDRFELGVERKPPTIDRYHVKDHICLSAPDVPKVTAELQAKPAMSEFPKAIADIHQLPSGKNVIEIYDLDGNRVELMEPPLNKAASSTTGN
jgi:catechol 2,3-dioxygenase-like lactoylglutathione lyase family enzyme